MCWKVLTAHNTIQDLSLNFPHKQIDASTSDVWYLLTSISKGCEGRVVICVWYFSVHKQCALLHNVHTISDFVLEKPLKSYVFIHQKLWEQCEMIKITEICPQGKPSPFIPHCHKMNWYYGLDISRVKHSKRIHSDNHPSFNVTINMALSFHAFDEYHCQCQFIIRYIFKRIF